MAVLAVSIGVIFLPVNLCFGPFDSVRESRAYLETAWQVVAAAVGLSVAIIAVLFSALLGGTARTVGISLVDFARGSGMMAVVRLGISALVVTGLVLFPIGHDAPRGWAGFWAALLAGSAFISVLWVFERAVVSLDPRGLAELRTKKVRSAAGAALHAQLLRQAAEHFLHQSGPRHGIGRALSAQSQDAVAVAERDGEVRDVRLGRLRPDRLG